MSSISDYVRNMIHEETQLHDEKVDLTVSKIYKIASPGRIDFGGGELKNCTKDPYPTEKRDEEDKYRWWNLKEGQYLIEYNEKLEDLENREALIQTRGEVLSQGVFHPTLRVSELQEIPISICNGGIKIKENARVSTIVKIE